MPFTAVPSVKLGVTLKPPTTALSSVAVKVIALPSAAEASVIVTFAASSSRIVPVEGPWTVTPSGTGGRTGPSPGKGPRE